MGEPWASGRLGDVCNVIPGYAFKSSDWQDTGIPVVKIKNVTRDNCVDTTDPDCVSESLLTQRMHKFLLRRGDILVAMTGATAGKVGRVQTERPLLLNQRVAKIEPKKASHQYIWAVLSSKEYQDRLFSLADGAAQPNMSGGQIEDLEIPIPASSAQVRIGGIVSAYDELVGNCQSRIGLLHRMASDFYREWFIEFRIPGYEQNPFVSSSFGAIPKGWEATSLGSQLAALESGKRPQGGARKVDDGVPSIGAENINGIGQHDFASEKFVPRDFYERMKRGVVQDRDVAIYKDGAYIGKSSYFRDGFPHAVCCVNEHVFLLRTTGGRLKQNALYLWLHDSATVQAIRSTNANAAQPGINQQAINGLAIVVPDNELAERFDALVEPLFAEMTNLAKRIKNLRATRGLLLPRLLSGQIDLGAV